MFVLKRLTNHNDSLVNLARIVSIEPWGQDGCMLRFGSSDKNHCVFVDHRPEEILFLPRVHPAPKGELIGW